MADSGADVVIRLTRTIFQQGALAGLEVQRRLDLGGSDVAALQVLDEAAGKAVRVGDLARRLGLSSAATTGLVDRLERAGLVRREPDDRDRRQVLVALEPAARRVGEQILEPWGERIAAAVAALAPAERTTVADFLRVLLGQPDPDPVRRREEHSTGSPSAAG